MLETISIGVVLLLWEIVFLKLPESLQALVPDPLSVLNAFLQLNMDGDLYGNSLLAHSIASLSRLIIGFSIAAFTGFTLGLLMSLRISFYRILKPLVEVVRPIPPIAWIPLAIAMLKIAYGSLFIIWLGAFFPILINTVAGVKRTSPVLIDVAKTFGADESTVTMKVVIPSALPEVFTGMRVGLGVGWMCIIAAEMIGVRGPLGLGYLVYMYGLGWGIIAPAVAGMVTIGFIAFLMNETFLRAEKFLFKWRVEIAR